MPLKISGQEMEQALLLQPRSPDSAIVEMTIPTNQLNAAKSG